MDGAATVVASQASDKTVGGRSDRLEELAVPDLSWVANTPNRYWSILSKMPRIFAWEESSDHLANLQILARSVGLRRLTSTFDHIHRYDSSLSNSMHATFEELPLQGKLRFLTAPETFYRISRLRRNPAESIIFLCNALNGEAAFYGLGPMRKHYMTALGDFYHSGSVPGNGNAGTEDERDDHPHAVRTLTLAETIPLDFDSPNTAHAQERKAATAHFPYSDEEKALICENLNAALARIKDVSPPAAHVIKEHIKVIIPIKTAVPGHGSTSQSRYPGRVLLRNTEQVGLNALASSLVHEAMHQVLYILELCGRFVIEHADADSARVKSGWTGRDLPLHAHIHACFIWYGLAKFWACARYSGAFDQKDVQKQLAKCLAGFRKQDPVEELRAHAGLLRYDVLKVAATLRSQLQTIMDEVPV